MNAKFSLPNLWKQPAVDNGRDLFDFLRREIDQLFDNFGRSTPAFSWANGVAAPKVNIVEKDKKVEITAELPGVELKDIELSIVDDVPTIKGEKRAEKEEKDQQRYVYERSYGNFSRSIQLPFETTEKAIDASFKDGVLTVTIPVPANTAKASKKIEVKAAA